MWRAAGGAVLADEWGGDAVKTRVSRRGRGSLGVGVTRGGWRVSWWGCVCCVWCCVGSGVRACKLCENLFLPAPVCAGVRSTVQVLPDLCAGPRLSRSPETAAVGCASARSLVAWRGSAIPPTPSSMRAAVSTVTPPSSAAAGTRNCSSAVRRCASAVHRCWHEELHLRCPPLRLRHPPLRLMLLQKFRYQVQYCIVVRKLQLG